ADGDREQLPVVAGLGPPLLGEDAWGLVVHEQRAVADEDAVADRHSVADEGVALDLAVAPDHGAALDLHEGADPGAVADPAAVEVGEREDGHALPELDVLDRPVGRVVGGLGRHGGTVPTPFGAGRRRPKLRAGGIRPSWRR